MERICWVDAIRGLAVIMMVVFHFFVDLDFFGIKHFSLDTAAWQVFGRLIAIIFIFLVGFSLVLSYSRKEAKKAGFKKYAKRGLKIVGYGLIITLITALLFPDNFVIFGILHFIGFAIIISYPLVKQSAKQGTKHNAYVFSALMLILSVLAIAIGIVLDKKLFAFPYLLWLGLKPNLNMLDYFPLFPWLGVVWIGIAAGCLYVNKRINKKNHNSNTNTFRLNLFINLLAFLGRHSLIIYLAHQPILAGGILIYKFIATN
jgi:uncharacterized membrane protein